ncbi:MAG: hypothetical protein ACI9RI_000867 [Oceanospirillaceae bacterium]|jgi:hypothetical protein
MDKKTRKIIQIVDSPMDDLNEGCITALCDDGSVWFYCKNGWTLLPEQIPQGYIKQSVRL